jgi:CRISPR-associated protein Cas1
LTCCARTASSGSCTFHRCGTGSLSGRSWAFSPRSTGPLLGPWTFAYRPGLGVADAVQALARLRQEGLGWVARTDVADCFASIPIPHLRRMVAALVDDRGLLGLVEAFLGRVSTGDGGIWAVPGLAQGSPLSPMWMNLVLTRLDDRLADVGFPTIRYADDLAAAAGSRDEAWEAMRVASDAVGELGMRLGAEKSDVMSFADGFTFLGEDFGPRYPPVMDDHRAVEPARRVLYAGVQGCRVRLAAGRLIVESGQDQELLNVPSGQMERLVCFGAVGVSAGVRSWALATGVEMVFLSRRGSYLGQAWGGGDRTRVFRLRAQLTVADDPARSLRFGRALVEAKIRKQAIVLRRLARREDAQGRGRGRRVDDPTAADAPRRRHHPGGDGYRGCRRPRLRRSVGGDAACWVGVGGPLPAAAVGCGERGPVLWVRDPGR